MSKKIFKKKKAKEEQVGWVGKEGVFRCNHDKGINSQPRNRPASMWTLGL